MESLVPKGTPAMATVLPGVGAAPLAVPPPAHLPQQMEHVQYAVSLNRPRYFPCEVSIGVSSSTVWLPEPPFDELPDELVTELLSVVPEEFLFSCLFEEDEFCFCCCAAFSAASFASASSAALCAACFAAFSAAAFPDSHLFYQLFQYISTKTSEIYPNGAKLL